MARTHPSPKTAPPPDAAQASAALSAGKFREAAEIYKDLLKHEPRPEWTQGLADAYAGRAGQMAAKGMFQEALALWRTRAQACGLPLLDGPYVDWLARTGSLGTALPALLAAAHEGPPEQQVARQGRLAAAVLAASPEALAQVPADSPLMQHRNAARQALAAVAAGDMPALEAALQGIPFRSPYRDLRPLLKALVLIRTDAPAAAAILARVAAGGAFEALAAPLRVAVQPAPQWLAAWQGLPAPARDLVLDLKGCPSAHRPLVEALAALPGAPEDEALAGLFKLLARFQKVLPRGLARRWALRVWPHLEQRRPTEFKAAFGSLAEHEIVHAHALAAQIRQDLGEAEHHWQGVARLLARQPGQARRAALVLRRLAQRPLAAGAADESVAGWLEQSLALDPDDRGTHLDLIRARRLLADPKQARERLEAALARWPDDAALLQQGVELALESGAFKKAATLAKQVQRLDPLNPRVPELIGQAHVAHARKLIKTRKPEAARRELEQAATWLREPAGVGRLKLLRALAAPEGEAKGLLRQALAELGGPLVGGFHVALEGQRVQADARAPLAQAGHDNRHAPTAAEVLALVQALNAEPPRDRAVAAAIEALLPQLQQAARSGRFSEDDFVQVGEALHRHRLQAATRCFMAAGRRQWPRNAVLLYLDLAGAYMGKPWDLPAKEEERLEQAFRAAQAQGDARAAKRIADLLDGVPDPHAPGSRPRRRSLRVMGSLDDDDDDMFGFDLPDLEAIPPAQFAELVSRLVPPDVGDEFHAKTKGLSPEQLKQQVLQFAEQLRASGPPPRARRKGRT